MAGTVNLRPGKLNIKMARGDTAAPPILIREGGVAADLTGRTYNCQIRRTTKTTTIIPVTVDTTDAATGIIVLRVSELITATLTGNYVWDLEQVKDNIVRTILAGTWTFDADVTRIVI